MIAGGSDWGTCTLFSGVVLSEVAPPHPIAPPHPGPSYCGAMAPAASDSVGAEPAQWGVWCLMSTTLLANFAVRYSLPPLQLFIAQELGLGEAQRAALLGAFFSGYIVTQFPAGLAVQRVGPKPIVTANLLGHAIFLALLPAAARFGSGGIYTCLVGIGLSQGPLGPCHAAQKVDCVPSTGPLRAYALTLSSIGSKIAGPLAGMAVPPCAARFGWRAVSSALAVAVGATAALWHACGPAPKPLADSGASGAEAQRGPAIEWRVFRTSGVLATAVAHLIDNFSTCECCSFLCVLPKASLKEEPLHRLDRAARTVRADRDAEGPPTAAR